MNGKQPGYCVKWKDQRGVYRVWWHDTISEAHETYARCAEVSSYVVLLDHAGKHFTGVDTNWVSLDA